jgi:hypothetical protein
MQAEIHNLGQNLNRMQIISFFGDTVPQKIIR